MLISTKPSVWFCFRCSRWSVFFPMSSLALLSNRKKFSFSNFYILSTQCHQTWYWKQRCRTKQKWGGGQFLRQASKNPSSNFPHCIGIWCALFVLNNCLWIFCWIKILRAAKTGLLCPKERGNFDLMLVQYSDPMRLTLIRFISHSTH